MLGVPGDQQGPHRHAFADDVIEQVFVAAMKVLAPGVASYTWEVS
jgi:hypothetical protein